MQVLMLTSSGKHGGACVTGCDMETGELIRLVSDAETGEAIPFGWVQDVRPMDVVQFEAVKSCPLGPQTENVLVKPFSISSIGNIGGDFADLVSFYNLLSTDIQFMKSPGNHVDAVNGYKHSLEIIHVSKLEIRKVGNYKGSPTGRAFFIFNGLQYNNFRVTDPRFDIRQQDTDTMIIGDAFLIMSIPAAPYVNEEGTNFGYYKFVAAIYPDETE